jgi:CRP-like cAMP-binding protein
MNAPDQSFTRNRLLGLMSAGDFALLQPHLERVELKQGYVLFESDTPIEHAYFLEGGVGSIVAGRPNEDEIEVGVYGREGMSGLPLVLGADRTADRSFIQINGSTALRTKAEDFTAAIGKSETLRTLLLPFAQVMTLQATRTIAANAFLELPGRLARWLLMCHDRVDGDTLALTHEFLSIMLAVRRSGVTVTMHALEATGAISARRATVIVRDRGPLEELAGEYYGAPEAAYRSMIGPFGRDR